MCDLFTRTFNQPPLLLRAQEFKEAAERIRAEARALKLMRERITLQRRDVAKLIEVAIEEAAPGSWGQLWRRFRALVEQLPRRASIEELEPFAIAMDEIRLEVDKALEILTCAENTDANESQNERQHSDSKPHDIFEFELAFEKARSTAERQTEPQGPPKTYPLGLVLKACPDIVDYAINGISSWRELMATAAQVRGYLGVSPSAYEDACHVMGQEAAAIVVACILQRNQHINSAGGYLRALTDKARVGKFSIGPMLMAALKAQWGDTTLRTG